ncbi:hypothetical protein DM860_001476 [Cuscuta australis]|uniref:RRM domain-containing protein n=1 Tax=Cuscuta australis TaxID=267555 RepID=A0A328ECF2_9ASTE|nr:hypothetical protein DM860_001476 [Cuscuta australis]
MGRYRSRSRSHSPGTSNRYEDRLDRRVDRRSPPPSGLLVRNISLNSRPEDIRIPFARFGPLRDVYLPKDYYSGELRGFGFVKFRYPEDAAEAKKCLNRTVIGGREIRIDYAEENRKTPNEMRRLTRTSYRQSSRRHSPSRSPRRRYHSYSRSPTPARHDLRERRRDAHYSSRRSRSLSRSLSPVIDSSKERRARRSRSVARSVSPHRDRHARSRSPRTNGHVSNEEDPALRES